MRICGIICEYNPLHDGHAYLLQRARAASGCDAVVCVMSGNFVQRGGMSIFEKHLRAEHAVRAGADAVLELPALFACAPAEIFARGAVRILNALPSFTALAFGAECADKEKFLRAAQFISDESKEFRTALKKSLDGGMSYAKARADALAACGEEELCAFLQTPNNILGAEYARALLAEKSMADILPVLRRGSAHGDPNTGEDGASATAVRAALEAGKEEEAGKYVPDFVARNFPSKTSDELFKEFCVYSLLLRGTKEIGSLCDCSEGLENKLFALASSGADFDAIVQACTSRRYISSRIRRILTASALGLTREKTKKTLGGALYLRPLALASKRADELLAEFSRASFPLLMRTSDREKLSHGATAVLETDLFAEKIYAIAAKKAPPAFGPRFV